MAFRVLCALALARLLGGASAAAVSEEATEVRLVDERGSDVLAQARAEHQRGEEFQPEADALTLSFSSQGTDFEYQLVRRSVVAAGAVVSVDGKSQGQHAEAHTFTSPSHDAVISIIGRSFHGAVRVGPSVFDLEADHGGEKLLVTRSRSMPGKHRGVFLNGTVISSSEAVEDTMATHGSVQGDGRRLRFAPDLVKQWTSCFHQDSIVRKFKFGAAIGSKLFHNRFGGNVKQASQWLQSIVAKANMVYEPQLHVVLEVGYLHIVENRHGAPSWDQGDGCPFTTRQQLDKWSQWSFPDKSMGVWHVFDDCYTGAGGLGIAWIGTLCSGYQNTAVNWYDGDNTWWVFAHEMGHNFGAEHSFELGKGNTGGIMDYGDGSLKGIYQFNTQYRKQEICGDIDRTVSWCPAFSHFQATCGNGVVETGEACECDECEYDESGATCSTACSGCCNCQLQGGKECVPNSLCCTANGMWSPVSKTCTGPGGQKGFCSRGACQTDIACNNYPVFFRDFCGFHSDNDCKISCMRNQQCDNLESWAFGGKQLSHAPDGTPCGSGQQGSCKDGKCSTGTVGIEDGDGTEYEPGEVIPYSTSKNVTGCVGFADSGFLGRADVAVWKGNQTLGMTLEDCDQHCLDDPVCHSFIFRSHAEDQDGLCELWTRFKTVDDLATTPSYDTYICDARAAGVDFPDAERFPDQEISVPSGSGIVPRSAGQGDGFTPSTCYKSCVTDPECHVFEYSSERLSCTLWSSDVSERNLVFANESLGMSTYILPCHGKGQVCPCQESYTSKLRISCHCGDSRCGVDQYCFDNRCSNSPARRLSTCTATPAPRATPSPTARRPTPAPTQKDTSNCADTNGWAQDRYYAPCNSYATRTYWCGLFDDADFSSNVMCCTCGGGSTGGATPAVTRAPTPAPPNPGSGACEDTNNGALGKSNSGCSFYAEYMNYCGVWNDADFSSDLMCCICGGGQSGGGCVDSNKGTVDAQNDGCAVYKQNTAWCGKFDDADFSAGVMCCACHGLVPTPAPGHNPESCGDTAGDALDPYWTSCDLYVPNPAWCGKYNDDDFSSEIMCCACGGGGQGTAAPTRAPTPSYPITTTKKKDDFPSSSPTPPPPGSGMGAGVVDGTVAQHPVTAPVLAVTLVCSMVFPVLA